MRIRLNHRYFRFRWVTSGPFGELSEEKRTIQVRSDLTTADTLDTIIHECLHGCFPCLDEEAVETAATDIARALVRLGVRVGGAD